MSNIHSRVFPIVYIDFERDIKSVKRRLASLQKKNAQCHEKYSRIIDVYLEEVINDMNKLIEYEPKIKRPLLKNYLPGLLDNMLTFIEGILDQTLNHCVTAGSRIDLEATEKVDAIIEKEIVYVKRTREYMYKFMK